MKELLAIGILPLLLTLGTYQIGLFCQKKLKTAIANPVLISVILVLVFMAMTGLKNSDYQAGMTKFSWLLTPATVCLAIPMYQHFQTLKRNLSAIFVGIAAGTVSCLAMVLLWGVLLNVDPTLVATMLPKSVTSAIGVPLSSLNGGIQSITTAAIILTGILASVTGPVLCKLFQLKDEISRGVAFGTAGHVIGTAKANEFSPLTGAVSSLSLVVAGLLTALVMPLVLP